MFESEQPLLDRQIILLSGFIDDAMYRQFVWALSTARRDHPKDPIMLWITCPGGATDLAVAMADLVQNDGNVWGVIMGKAASGAASIWASCSHRYATPNSILGIHQVVFVQRENLTAVDSHMMSIECQRRNQQIIQTLTTASNCSTEYWTKALLSTNMELVTYDFDDLILFNMARPFSMLDADRVRALMPPEKVAITGE